MTKEADFAEVSEGPDAPPGGDYAAYAFGRPISDVFSLRALSNPLRASMSSADYEDARKLALIAKGGGLGGAPKFMKLRYTDHRWPPQSASPTTAGTGSWHWPTRPTAKCPESFGRALDERSSSAPPDTSTGLGCWTLPATRIRLFRNPVATVTACLTRWRSIGTATSRLGEQAFSLIWLSVGAEVAR